jgi:hypothetical protein
VNIGRKGVRQTFGLRGTGLSYTTWRILYRGDPGMGIVLLIFSAIILILAHAICASGANPEPITPPRDASLARRRTLTHSILYGDKAVAKWLMASQITVYIAPGASLPGSMPDGWMQAGMRSGSSMAYAGPAYQPEAMERTILSKG